MSASSWSGWYRITPRLASRPLYGVLHGEPAYSTGTESTSIKTRILSKEYSRTFSEFCLFVCFVCFSFSFTERIGQVAKLLSNWKSLNFFFQLDKIEKSEMELYE